MARAYGDPAVPTAVIDFDGTLVPAIWPGRPETFMPGAVDAMRRLHKEGFRLLVWSARLAPVDPWGADRDPGEVASEVQWMRSLLDSAGLTFMDIHTKPYKPGADVYVDDKAERYNPCVKCWDKLVTRILLRHKGE